MRKTRSPALSIFGLLLLYAVYTFCFFVYATLAFRHGLLLSRRDLTTERLLGLLAQDLAVYLPFSVLLGSLYRSSLAAFRVPGRARPVVVAMCTVYLLLFALHRDFSTGGVYNFFFYLISTGVFEEYLFRGVLYTQLRRRAPTALAVAVSGFFWGIGHAAIPYARSGGGIGVLAQTMASNIGGFVVVGILFAYLLEKSGTIWVPVLLHAAIDYSYGPVGILLAGLLVIYYMVKQPMGPAPGPKITA